MMLVLDRDPSQGAVPGFPEIESQTVRLIDRIKVSMELKNESFEEFEKNVLYPFLKLLIKKFLSYFILKKLVEIANECSMLVTAEKISSSLNSLEKRLFNNNKLHQSPPRNHHEDIDLEAEMKRRFGFDARAQKKATILKENQSGLFRKKTSNCATKKKRNAADNGDINRGNRSSLFYNKFIKKSKQRRGGVKAKGPVQEMTHKKPIKSGTRLWNVGASFQGPGAENDVPDFYRLNKLISQNSENVMDLSQARHERRAEALRKERLRNRKLPNPSRQRGPQRRLKRSFNYTKLIKRKKYLGDQNDENIINLKSRADILMDFRQEMFDDLKQGSQEEALRATGEGPRVIGVPNEDERRLAQHLKEVSPSNSFSRLGPNFDSFMIESRVENVVSENKVCSELESTKDHIKSEDLEKSLPLAEKENNNEAELESFMSKKKTKKKMNEVVYEIGTDDWENNVFGKNTPNKEFPRKNYKPNIKT